MARRNFYRNSNWPKISTFFIKNLISAIFKIKSLKMSFNVRNYDLLLYWCYNLLCIFQPFKCEICGKGMTQKSGYKKHMLTHTGELPYTCNICNKQFRYSSNLIMHKRSHIGQKNFECTVRT